MRLHCWDQAELLAVSPARVTVAGRPRGERPAPRAGPSCRALPDAAMQASSVSGRPLRIVWLGGGDQTALRPRQAAGSFRRPSEAGFIGEHGGSTPYPASAGRRLADRSPVHRTPGRRRPWPFPACGRKMTMVHWGHLFR